eukprot:7377809-Prymnesium_polylepis.1
MSCPGNCGCGESMVALLQTVQPYGGGQVSDEARPAKIDSATTGVCHRITKCLHSTFFGSLVVSVAQRGTSQAAHA